ncbi:MAG TPA: nuclear transport factor 2 family protein [Herpetosiphonaceae bacterium]|nr:nuclear transport factor 2 family protein [Herpetosiphonaceae bacterium]
MEREKAKQLTHQFIDALHRLEAGSGSDVEDIVSLFGSEARLTNAALHGKELTGQDGAREFWSEYRRTFGQARSEFSHVIVDEHASALFWRTEGTGQDDRRLAYDGVSLLEWSDDGKITFFRGYYDTGELSREVGIDQQPGRSH